jgi:hypothetical protein
MIQVSGVLREAAGKFRLRYGLISRLGSRLLPTRHPHSLGSVAVVIPLARQWICRRLAELVWGKYRVYADRIWQFYLVGIAYAF